MCLPAAVASIAVGGDETAVVIEQVEPGIGSALEVDHAVERSGEHVKGAGDALATEPVVFDETGDRRLIGDNVVDVVALRIGRDYEQGNTRAVAATSLGMLDADAGES